MYSRAGMSPKTDIDSFFALCNPSDRQYFRLLAKVKTKRQAQRGLREQNVSREEHLVAFSSTEIPVNTVLLQKQILI